MQSKKYWLHTCMLNVAVAIDDDLQTTLGFKLERFTKRAGGLF